jgi:hypothetical protein
MYVRQPIQGIVSVIPILGRANGILFPLAVGVVVVSILVAVQVGAGRRAGVILPVLVHDPAEAVDAGEHAAGAGPEIQPKGGFI